MDVSVEPFDPEKVAQARLVAVSVPMHTALRLGVAVAERVRAINPTCHICFYGLYAALNADHLLAHHADSVFGGEIESALVELIEKLAQAGSGGRTRGEWGSEQASSPPALRAVTHLEKLDFPVPSRSQLPALKRYAHLERDGQFELAGYIEASRGCKHHCQHCPIPPLYGGRFFVVPKAVVLGDVRQLVTAGATHVTFGDPDFLNGPGHALAVARAVHAEFPTLTFDFTAKVEHLLRQRRHLPELASLGCAFIVSAAESLSETVLANLAKGHTRADIVEALRLCRAAGIALRPTWVAFTPWTTLADYREMLAFVEAEGLVDSVDPVQFSIRLLVPPGSLLLKSPEMQPHLRERVQDSFYYRWEHPDPRVDGLHEAVSRLTAEAAESQEDGAVTFARVVDLADVAMGAALRSRASEPAADRRRPPRLTEPWFC
jgi:radical SAM superfamily enzyme YgiQ (UPF0313 family)